MRIQKPDKSFLFKQIKLSLDSNDNANDFVMLCLVFEIFTLLKQNNNARRSRDLLVALLCSCFKHSILLNYMNY